MISTIFLSHFFNFFAVSSLNNFFSISITTSWAFVIKSCHSLDKPKVFDTTHFADFLRTIYHFFSKSLTTFEIIIGSRSRSFAILFWERSASFSFRVAQERYCIIMYCAWVRSNSFNALLRDFCRYWVVNQSWYPVSFFGLEDIKCVGDNINIPYIIRIYIKMQEIFIKYSCFMLSVVKRSRNILSIN